MQTFCSRCSETVILMNGLSKMGQRYASQRNLVAFAVSVKKGFWHSGGTNDETLWETLDWPWLPNLSQDHTYTRWLLMHEWLTCLVVRAECHFFHTQARFSEVLADCFLARTICDFANPIETSTKLSPGSYSSEARWDVGGFPIFTI